MLRNRKLILVVAAALAVTALAAGAVSAATRTPAAAVPYRVHDVRDATSSNWAGYAVTSADAAKKFTSVSGSWKQPAVTCDSGKSSTAFWVGLGGFKEGSSGLEQTGTEVDCAGGRPTYTAWYELVPSPSVNVDLPVRPGDTFNASVAVSGENITFRLENATVKKVFTKKVSMRSPSINSAEWVTEAPSACVSHRYCHIMELAKFGTVTFTGARAATADTSGTITNPAWARTVLTIGKPNEIVFPQLDVVRSFTEARPSALSADGSSFSVTSSDVAPPSTPSTLIPIPFPIPLPIPAPPPSGG